MTIESVQARVQTIQARFDPNYSRDLSGSEAATFAAVLGQVGQLQLLGSPSFDGGQPFRAGPRLGLPTLSFVSQLGLQTRPDIPVGSAAEFQYQELFRQAGERYGVDPALLAAVASVESGFNPLAQSPAGAQGLMQFMPATAREMGVDSFDPASAIDGAARYLRRELERFGSVELASAAYNAGANAVKRYGGVPPFSETQNYVRKILSAYEARR